MEQHLDEMYLKIAVQTVLHRRRDQIDMLLSEHHLEVLEDLAREITERAIELQHITEKQMDQLDSTDD